MDSGLMRGGLTPAPSLGNEDIARFKRRADRLRAEAMAEAFAALAGGLKSLWRGIGRWWRAQAQARMSIGEMRSLSDRILKDIGLRRDQIDCFNKQIPC